MAWQAHADFARVMENFDILVCPTNAATDVPADYGYPKQSYKIDGQPRTGGEDKLRLTSPFNMLSRLPVMSCPTGFAANGVPTGMQIVGHAYDDSTVLNASLAYEASWIGSMTPSIVPVSSLARTIETECRKQINQG